MKAKRCAVRNSHANSFHTDLINSINVYFNIKVACKIILHSYPPHSPPQFFKLNLPSMAAFSLGFKCTPLIAIKSMLPSRLRNVVMGFQALFTILTVAGFLPVTLIILAQPKESWFIMKLFFFFLTGQREISCI